MKSFAILFVMVSMALASQEVEDAIVAACYSDGDCRPNSCCQTRHYDDGGFGSEVVSRKKRDTPAALPRLMPPSIMPIAGMCNLYLQEGQYCSENLAGRCGCAPGLQCIRNQRHSVCLPEPSSN